MRVLVFGDSIAQGYWDAQGGWVERLRKHYWQRYLSQEDYDPPSVFNLGVSSNAASDVLERLESETRARNINQGVVIVIAVGINDSRLKGAEPFSSPEAYEQTMRQLIELARTFTDKILVVGSTACDESLANPVAWRDTSYQNDRIWEFETVLRQVAEQESIAHVPLFEDFTDKNDLFSDGLHPNDAGHERIYELVLPELEKLIQ